MHEKHPQITSQKLKYNAEVAVIKSKLGDIEEIRNTLQISQRKICQLLMVDPSAWTRWVSKKTPIPAHIYRSLQWYMALIEKNGEWHPQNSFMRAFQPTNSSHLKQSLSEHEAKIDQKIVSLQYESLLAEKRGEKQANIILFLCITLVFQSVLAVFIVLK